MAPLPAPHLAAQGLPSPVPGDDVGLWIGNPTLGEGTGVRGGDEQAVREAVPVEPRGRVESGLPVLAGLQLAR